MLKNKKTTNTTHIDVKKMIVDTEKNFSDRVNHFKQEYLAKIVPNEINLVQLLNTLIVKGRAIKTYNNSEVMVTQCDPRSFKIENLPGSKVAQDTTTPLRNAGYVVTEKDGVVFASLAPLSGMDRERMAKEIKAKKEDCKQSINRYRQDFMDKVKNAPESEANRAKKEIEEIKNKLFKVLEDLVNVKIKVIMGN